MGKRPWLQAMLWKGLCLWFEAEDFGGQVIS